MSRLKKLILASTVLLELIVILIVYLIFFRNSEYEDIVKKYDLVYKIGDYEIYGKGEYEDAIEQDIQDAYLIHDKKIIDHNSFGYLTWLDEKNINEIDVNYFIYIGNYQYLINKEKNIISKPYDSIGEGWSATFYAYGLNPDSTYIVENDKYGLLNIDTCKEYIEPKFDYLDELGKNKFIAKSNDGVGLYTKTGEEIFKPGEYDYIGSVLEYGETDEERKNTYITIKGDEIKIFDDDMKDTLLNVTKEHRILGLYNNDKEPEDQKPEQIIYDNIKDNFYFKYKGDMSGKQYFMILQMKCSDSFIEYTERENNDEEIVYVIKDGKLVKLDPSLIEPTDNSCGK